MASKKRKRIIESPEQVEEPAEVKDTHAVDPWAPDSYLYEPGEPIHIEQLERVIGIVADEESHNTFELLQNKNLFSFIEGMSRVRPYCDKKAKGSIDRLNDVWSARLAAYEEEKEFEAQEKTYPDSSGDDIIGVNALSPEKRGLPDISDGGIKRNKRTRAIETVQRPIKRPQELPTIDETLRPYSAWLLHTDIHKRILAASRYITAFPDIGMRLAKDPALDKQARKEALGLLYKGGSDNVYVGSSFLDAYRGQLKWERRHPKEWTDDQLAACDCSQCYKAKRDEERFMMSDGEDA